jgi:glycosyltransferase involved in cell wall biosynthesis
MTDKMNKVSIIVACFNEGIVLDESLNFLIKFMDSTTFEYEVILVDDKSEDDTLARCKSFVDKYSNFKLISHPHNRGRGKTVTDGILASKYDVVAFIDIDLETPVHYLLPLFKTIEEGADVAVAERIYKIKTHSIHRWILSKGYMYLVKLYCKSPLLDTESGCKAFNKKSILQVLTEIEDERWFWDTEVVVRSYYKKLIIKQVPTLFIRRREIPSTVKLFRDSIRQFAKLLHFSKEIKKKYFASSI